MAELRFYENIFEENYRTIEYDPSKTLKQHIEEYTREDLYEGDLVECYDLEEDRTYYAPIIEDIENPCVMISTQGKDISIDYEVLPNDIINIVYLPLSSNDWSWGGAIIGGLASSITYGLAGAFVTGGFNPVGLAIGAGVGFIIGFVAGGVIGPMIGNNSSSSTGKNEQKSLPDVRGAENQSLLNQNFPLLLGRHLITPGVVGDPYTTYEGDKGQDAYINIAYCAGYGPLKLTDFKFGDMILAYNRTVGDTSKQTMLSGLLRGSEDILNIWNNNDISLEIIQQPSNQGVQNRGTVYPRKVVDKKIDANVLYVADSLLDNVAETVYKGTTFPNKWRSNGVWFSEQCPEKVRICLSAPNGLYASRTHTKTNKKKTENNVEYDSIPLWFAIQWRPYSENNAPSDSNGGDYNSWRNIKVWNGRTDFLQHYGQDELMEDIKAHLGNDLPKEDEEFYSKNYLSNLDALNLYLSMDDNTRAGHGTNVTRPTQSGFKSVGIKAVGNDSNSTFCNSKTLKVSVGYLSGKASGNAGYAVVVKTSYEVKNGKTIETKTKNTLYLDFTSGDETDINHIHTEVGTAFTVQTVSTDITLYCAEDPNDSECYDSNGIFIERRENVHSVQYHIDEIAVFGRMYTSEFAVVPQIAKGWYDKDLLNFQGMSGEDYTGELRLSAEIDVYKEIGVDPLLASDNRIQGIEIRCIRVSPNYINQTGVSDQSSEDQYSAQSYSDVIKVLSIQTEVFDKQKYIDTKTIEPVYIASDDDFKKFCYIAIRAKADASGYISQSLKRLNCIAECFAPIYSSGWLPAGIVKTTKYYAYYNSEGLPCNRGDSVTEISVNKEEYEKGRRAGYDWVREFAGTNYKEKMDAIVFEDSSYHNGQLAYYLTSNGANYNTCNSASMFMLALVGPQNKSAAQSYDQIDTASVGEWYDDCTDVTDGSTYSEPTVFNGTWYEEGSLAHFAYECNAYITQGIKLEDLLSKIAFTGRAMYTYNESGQIRVVMDKPVDYPVGVINSQNLINGSSNTYSYEELPAALRFDFNDENDGYGKNGIYCFSDAFSIGRYHGDIEPYTIDFVTNPRQIWSLGRYVMACRLQSREVLTRKVGIEGNTYSLGDVVLVQDDELLIGSGSGRIQEVLENALYIYGFITDTPFDTKLFNDNSKIPGVNVFQPSKYGKSRIITDKIKFGSVVVNEKTYTSIKGITNVILFDEPKVKANNDDPSVSTNLKYSFKTGDIVMLGDIEKISAPYRITKIKPEKDGTFTETLVIYDEKFYNYGDKMPSFQTYITEPPVMIDPITLSDAYSIAEIDRRASQNINSLQNLIINGYGKFGEPDLPIDIKCYAAKLKIVAEWKSPLCEDGSMRNNIAYYKYQIRLGYDDAGDEVWSTVYTTSGTSMEFKVGYLEWNDFEPFAFRIQSVNISKQTSEWSSVYYVDTSNYGTWKVNKPVNSTIVARKEWLELGCNYTPLPDREFYGTLKFIYKLYYDEEIRKENIANQTSFNYYFNRKIDGYPEKIFNARLDAEGVEIPLLTKYTLTVSAKCEETKYEEISDISEGVDVSMYGTWIPPELDATKISSNAVESGVEVEENLPFLPEERIGDIEGYYGQPYSREYQFDQDSNNSNYHDFNDICFNKYNFIREPSEEGGYYDGYPENPTSRYGTELYIKSLFYIKQGIFTDGMKNAFSRRPKFLGRSQIRGRYRSSVVADRYGDWSDNKPLDWSHYKTWIPEYNDAYCYVKTNKRYATFIGEQPENRPVFGNVLYGVLIAKKEQTDLDDILQPYDKYDEGYSPSSELNERITEHHLTGDTQQWSANSGLLTMVPSYQTLINEQTSTLEVTTQKTAEMYNWYNPCPLGDASIRQDEDSYKRKNKDVTPVKIQDLISKTEFNQNKVIETWVSRTYMQELPLIGQNYLMFKLECESLLRECEATLYNQGDIVSPKFKTPDGTPVDISAIRFSPSMEPYHWAVDIEGKKKQHYWAYYDIGASDYRIKYYIQADADITEEVKLTYIKTQNMSKTTSPLDDNLYIVNIPGFDKYAAMKQDESVTSVVEGKDISVIYRLTRVQMSNPIPTEYRYKIVIINASSGYSRIFDDTDDFNVIDFEVNANAVADLVDASITNTKLAKNCVTAENIAAGSIAADHIAAVDLLATGARVGMLSAEGVKVDNAGFWASKAFNYEYHPIDIRDGSLNYDITKNYITEPGEFFVGNTMDLEDEGAEFLHYLPSIHTFEFKISNFKVTAVQSLIKGTFSVKDTKEGDNNPFFTINPSDKADQTLGTSARTLRIGHLPVGEMPAITAKVEIHGCAISENKTMTITSGRPATDFSERSGTALFTDGIASKHSDGYSYWIRQLSASNKGIMEIATGNTGAEQIVVRQYNSNNTVSHSVTLMNESGGQDFDYVTATQVSGNGTSNRLIFRHLDGQPYSGGHELYLNYHAVNTNDRIRLGKGGSHYIEYDGSYYSGISEYTKQTYNDSNWMKFHWSGQDGQPTWLWGGNNGVDMYVYNPSNFSVNHSKTAETADVAGTANHIPTSKPDNNNGAVWIS